MSLIDNINSFRDGLNTWLSVIIKIMAIGLIILAIMWVVTSVVAHFVTDDGSIAGEPKISKAAHEFRIVNTGEVLLGNSYDYHISGTAETYILHGFYRVVNDKWVYQDMDIELNEYYFGPIEHQTRSE